jgi:hypothetical protein
MTRPSCTRCDAHRIGIDARDVSCCVQDSRALLCLRPNPIVAHGRDLDACALSKHTSGGSKLERQRDLTDERPLNVFNVLRNGGPRFARV